MHMNMQLHTNWGITPPLWKVYPDTSFKSKKFLVIVFARNGLRIPIVLADEEHEHDETNERQVSDSPIFISFNCYSQATTSANYSKYSFANVPIRKRWRRQVQMWYDCSGWIRIVSPINAAGVKIIIPPCWSSKRADPSSIFTQMLSSCSKMKTYTQLLTWLYQESNQLLSNFSRNASKDSLCSSTRSSPECW